METKTNVRAGGILNHNQTGIAVHSKVKAGIMPVPMNHNQTGIAVRSKVKADGANPNHNQTGIAVRSKVKAGGIALNHNLTAAIRPNLSR